jgi:ribonuclease HI
VDTGETHIEWRDGLTKEAAEYRAIIAAVRISDVEFNDYTNVVVRTDSEIVARHFTAANPGMDKALEELYRKVYAVSDAKLLEVEVESIPRSENLAAKLLDRRVKSDGGKKSVGRKSR